MKFFLHILIFSLCAFTVPRTIEPKVNIDFSTYYDYEEMGEVLVKLTNAYPDLLTLDVMGKSREGRDIWIITVNNPSTGGGGGLFQTLVSYTLYLMGVELSLNLNLKLDLSLTSGSRFIGR